MREIDELDRGIIKLLSDDGRMSFKALSNRLNVTEKTIRTLYKSLVDDEILEVVGIINPIALGVKSGAIVQLKIESFKLDEIIERLKSFKEIRYITLTSGAYQLIIQLNVPGQEQLTTMIKGLNKIDGIKETNSIIQLEVYKNSFQYL